MIKNQTDILLMQGDVEIIKQSHSYILNQILHRL